MKRLGRGAADRSLDQRRVVDDRDRLVAAVAAAAGQHQSELLARGDLAERNRRGGAKLLAGDLGLRVRLWLGTACLALGRDQRLEAAGLRLDEGRKPPNSTWLRSA